MAHVSAFLGSYGSPRRISGAAYDFDPQYVLQRQTEKMDVAVQGKRG